jgi:hypothetical protein
LEVALEKLWRGWCDPSTLNPQSTSLSKPPPESKKEGKELTKEDSKAPPTSGKGGKALGIITMSLSPNIIHISDHFNDPQLLK